MSDQEKVREKLDAFAWHELADRVSVVIQIWSDAVTLHEVLGEAPELLMKVREVEKAMADVYQAVWNANPYVPKNRT